MKIKQKQINKLQKVLKQRTERIVKENMMNKVNWHIINIINQLHNIK